MSNQFCSSRSDYEYDLLLQAPGSQGMMGNSVMYIPGTDIRVAILSWPPCVVASLLCKHDHHSELA